ncbi:MAG TPA: 30S ribosomal protein S7 [Candidatus Pacearchaeota archaeon]|nr:30S ribosomal protein S7 [Candidatus Pacearchaeota archaeon]
MATTKFRKLNPDPVYQSIELSKFTNTLMQRGQKETARRVVYRALDIIKEKTKQDPMLIFQEAVRQVSPLLEVKSKRVGGATYQVPHEVKGDRQQTLAFRWIIESARSVKGRPMAEKLAAELIAAAEGEGSAVQKKINTHKMAKANQAFAHFAR